MQIVVLSLHTSPIAQPGRGDAGGMNVYVDHVARALGAAGHEVDILTADPTMPSTGVTELTPHVRVHQLQPPADSKDGLGQSVAELTALLMAHPVMDRAEAIWAHYWISAAVALRWRASPRGASGWQTSPRGRATPTGQTDQTERTGTSPRGRATPIIVSLHTIGAVKNRDSMTLAEPRLRLDAETHIAAHADVLVANTSRDAADIERLLGAPADHIVIAPPGVDDSIFTPGNQTAARHRLGLKAAELIVLYVGRMQHIKGTDIVIDAFAELSRTRPDLAPRIRGILIGAVSGGHQVGEFRHLVASANLSEQVDIIPPMPATSLVDYYRAADLLLMPSRSESFGLVAAEATATGLPVLAADVGGLAAIVTGRPGELIASHDPHDWAVAIAKHLDQVQPGAPGQRVGDHRFTWQETVRLVLAQLAERAAREFEMSATEPESSAE